MGLRRHLPKTNSDFAAFCFLLLSIHSIAAFELFVVLPSIYSSSAHATPTGSFTLYYFHVIVGIFIYLNVILNLYKTIITNTTIIGKVMPTLLKSGWRFCYACESNAPPRSFHCFICNVCVLKRDHHCTFTGNCIGIFNQRYYIGLLLYMCLAAGYSCGLNFDFIYHLLGSLSVKSLLVILFPMVSWIFVQFDSVSSIQILMTSLCMVGFVLSGGLLVYHMINVINGQVVRERTYNITSYNLGWRENLAMSFGTRWKLALVCPLIESPIPSDGLEFVTKDQYESLKEI